MKHAARIAGLGILSSLIHVGCASGSRPDLAWGDDAGSGSGSGSTSPEGGADTAHPEAGGGDDSSVTDAASATDTGGPQSCGGGGGPTGGPADLFPCDSVWYRDVSALPVANESASLIAGVGSWGKGKFLIDTSIVFMHDDGTSPQVNFSIDWTDESNVQPVPIPPGGSLEGETGYTCNGRGDCHLIVVQDSTKKLFELYDATDNGNGTWHASQESVWDLTHHYGPDERGYNCTSADAAGLSVMAGLIGVREAVAGDIRHALRFILPSSEIRKGPSYVAPASHGTSATTSSSGPPYGTRLRLRASFDETTISSTGGRAVVRALKKYGMLLADGGNYALTAEDDRLEKAKDPKMTWTGVLGGSDLQSISPQDFDVVDFGTVVQEGDCKLNP
jgi:serine/threonine-protein kinase